MVDECPNCGEPLSSDARVCPFCGSDEETGWRADADYYSIDLPDDEFFAGESAGRPARDGASRWPGAFLFIASATLFVWTTISTYGWSGLVPIAFLALCSLWLELGTRPPRETRRSA